MSRKKADILKDGKKTRFSKSRQPKKNGRKPHLMTDTIKALEAAGFKAVGREEIRKVWSIFLNLPESGIKAIIGDINRPLAERIIAKKLVGPKGDEAISELQDRVFGKSEQKHNIEGEMNLNIDVGYGKAKD